MLSAPHLDLGSLRTLWGHRRFYGEYTSELREFCRKQQEDFWKKWRDESLTTPRSCSVGYQFRPSML